MNMVFKGSPNYQKGRQGNKIDKIVIHWFGSGTLESANNRFQNVANQVSAHYGISKGRVWQWVKEEDTAFAAGNFAVNLRSINIEHDALPNQPLSEIDYDLSGQLVREIAQRYGIPLDRQHIIGHREVKNTTCPGSIDIDKIISIAKVMKPITPKAKVVINQPTWASLPAKLQAIKDWYKVNSGGRILLDFNYSYSLFENIDWRMDPTTESAIINETWFDEHVLDRGYDTTILVVRDEDLPDNFMLPNGQKAKLLARTLGYFGKKPTKTYVGCSENDMSENYPTENAFFDYVRHELMHTFNMYSGSFIPHKPPMGDEYFGVDSTHKYFYDLRRPQDAFQELNYENIAKTLAQQIVKPFKNGGEYGFLASNEDALIEMALSCNFPLPTKFVNGRTVVDWANVKI